MGVALISLWASSALAQTKARVEEMTPSGAAKDVRQVRARFATPMVAFGDPRAPTPFRVTCAAKSSSRWIDERNWVLDFAQNLPAGLRCELTLVDGLRDLAGQPVTGGRRFGFSTGGPAIFRVFPSGQIDEDAVLVLSLDAVPTAESLARYAYFTTRGTRDRIGLEVVESPERDALLKRFRWVVEPPRVPFVVRPKQRFPTDTSVTLVWGPGLATQSGVATVEAQRFEFKTRPPFRAELACGRQRSSTRCSPLGGIAVQFSSLLPARDASRLTLTPLEPAGPPRHGKTPATDGDPWTNRVEFPGPFPPRARFRLEVPSDLRDDAGRALENGARFPMELALGDYPPLAQFAARFGIVERDAEPALPVTLRRVESPLRTRSALRSVRASAADAREILRWLRAVVGADGKSSILSDSDRAAPRDIPRADGTEPLEVVGIPLAQPGLHVVEIESRLLSEDTGVVGPTYLASAALVTNLSVHFKWGDESSLVWVTSLEDAKPVAGARVSVFDCNGSALASGTTDADGIARFADLPGERDLPSQAGCGTGTFWSPYASGVLVVASSGDDAAFTHSSWVQGIEPWRYQLPSYWDRGPLAVHAVFDRALYRAGDTAHVKLFARDRVLAGFRLPRPESLAKLVRIQHQSSDDRFELPVTWQASANADFEWAIPRAAKLGDYLVYLADPAKPERGELAGSFRVEEFRVPTMRAQIRLDAEPLVTPKRVGADLSVRYLAGGGAAAAPVRVRTTTQPRNVASPPDFPDYAFGGEPVREGVESTSGDESAPEEPVRARDVTLDASGAARFDVADLPAVDRPMSLVLELEYKDANGEIRTASNAARLWPSERQIGLRAPRQASGAEVTLLDTVVLDLASKPRWRAPVRVTAYERQVFSHRERMIGGFYSWRSRTEIHELGELCAGKTDWGGRFRCEVKLPAKGYLLLDAVSSDSEGRETHARADVFVPGPGGWWFSPDDSDRMDLIPDRGRYEVGDTARLEVRMPFREATALVTIEREGVGESFVTRLSGDSPIVKIPVRANHSPNVFVSVLAIRGRVGGVKPTGSVDLGRPAAKLGIAELRVGRAPHELEVEVEPERDTYRVREKASAEIRVERADGESLPPGGEIAVAVVDDGLLELQPNTSWDLLEAMLGRRAYDVVTATGQTQVIGRRHFGLKAAAPGGGGGSSPTRELFDTLVYWQARVPLDANGRARVEFPLNDSLTRFRIAAIASAGPDLFGTATATLRTTQDLMLFSGLSPLVREGDRTRAEFTVRNAGGDALAARLAAKVQGLGAELAPLEVSLAPGESRDLGWDVVIPSGIESLAWDVELRAAAGASDRIHVVETVAPAVPVRVVQGTLARVTGRMELPVARPAGALPGRGGVRVSLQDSLVAAGDGIARWLAAYPYGCLEQQVSIAIGRDDRAAWDRLAAELPGLLDSDGLLKFFPSMRDGDVSLTAHVLALSDEAGFPLPAEVERRASEGLTRFVKGQLRRDSQSLAPDLVPRKLQALAALARRGAASGDLAGSLAVTPELWPTSSIIDWLEFLRRVSDAPARESQIARAEKALATRLHFEGTEMSFSWRGWDDLDWLLVDSDVNALRFLILALDSEKFAPDAPRIAQGAVQRMTRGAYLTTTANAWGRLALAKFAHKHEGTPVTGVTRLALAGESREVTWREAQTPPAAELGWPDAPSRLTAEQRGTGAPWAFVTSLAAIPLREPLAAGYHVAKSLTPVVQKRPGVWSRGDVVRVRLEIDAQADKSWLVVDDPIPAGASILDGGLGGSSTLAAEPQPETENEEWPLAWPTFSERSFAGLRRYYEWAPKGRFRVEYTMRLSQSGRFELPPTHVEAMYAPGMHGDLPNAVFEIAP